MDFKILMITTLKELSKQKIWAEKLEILNWRETKLH